MKTDYQQSKNYKRNQLKLERNRNIKRAMVILLVLLIAFAFINRQWQIYQEDIYRDKSYIMNQNKRLTYDFSSGLEGMNSLIRILLFDQPYDVESARRDLTDYVEQVNELRDFRYDHGVYQIDSFHMTDPFYMQREVITYGLKKSHLTQEEKAGFAALLRANEKVLADYKSVYAAFNKRFSYEDGNQEEGDYLYYYLGEVFFILINAIDVHMAGLDCDFIEEVDEPIYTYDEPQLSEDDMSLYAGYFCDIFLGHPLEDMAFEASYADTRSGRRLYGYDFTLETEGIHERFSIGTEGSFYYYLEERDSSGSFNAKKNMGALLSETELLSNADTLINSLGQSDLKRISYQYGTLGENRDEVLSISYMIESDTITDRRAGIELDYFMDGRIRSLYVGNYQLLTGSYDILANKKGLLTEEEALSLLPLDVQTGVTDIILDMSRDPSYVITFHMYDLKFMATVSGKTGEIYYSDYIEY